MSPSDSHNGQRLTFRIPLLEVATFHRRGSLTLPRSPCAHAAPTTPAGDDELCGRLLPHHPAAFPIWQEGRLQQGTFEACSGFTRVAACTLVYLAIPGVSGGFSRTVTRIDCSGDYRGVPTTPRAGLPPAGDRDPGGHRAIRSVHFDPPFVTHCHPSRSVGIGPKWAVRRQGPTGAGPHTGGRVDGERGGCRSGIICFSPFRLRVPQYPSHGSVSRRRSSNRTCGATASGSRTDFATRHS